MYFIMIAVGLFIIVNVTGAIRKVFNTGMLLLLIYFGYRMYATDMDVSQGLADVEGLLHGLWNVLVYFYGLLLPFYRWFS